MEGSGHNLHRDIVSNFYDKTEETHEAVGQCTFPLSQDFNSKTKTLIPKPPPTRFFIRNLFSDNLGWKFCILKRFFMQLVFISVDIIFLDQIIIFKPCSQTACIKAIIRFLKIDI